MFIIISSQNFSMRSLIDSTWLANVERVHGYLVPENCMQIVSCIYRKGCSGVCSGKKHGLLNSGSCSCRARTTGEIVVKPTGQRYAKHFYKFEIKLTGSFKSNIAYF